MATAADVPGIYDVVINGQGYIFSRTIDQSLPFRVQRANYGYSPTFVDRSNVSNQYGDNAQDFFLTVRQRDWSLGEQQKFFRTGQDGRYWMGSNVDVSTPGQVTLFPQSPSLSFAGTVITGAREGASDIGAASATNLYRVNPVGTITDLGAHGLGASPRRWGACLDGFNLYLASTSGGSVGVRKWTGAAFSTFSATTADALAFLNNTLYGFNGNTETLIQYDTAGTATTLFSWKDAAGAAQGVAGQKLEPYGGKLLILLGYGQEAGGELWIYDGSATRRLEVFPPNFYAYDVEVLYGVAYISGSFFRPASSTTIYTKPAVLFYDGGQIGKLWESNSYSTTTVSTSNFFVSNSHPPLGVFDGKLLFTDENNGNLMAYNPVSGGVSTVGSYATGGDSPRLLVSGTHIVHTRNQTTGYYLPSATYPTSGYVISSLIDFESSLAKLFRGIKVEWDAATDGNGGSVDIAYQVDSLTGSWTTLQTGAVSGTEYGISGVSGRSIAVKITINKGTSTSGPTLKALSIKGAPLPTQYRQGDYIIDCTGRDGKTPVILNDRSRSPLDGLQLMTNLKTAITATSPFSITDRLGTYTGLCTPDKCEIIELRPEEYLVRVSAREV